VVPELAVAGYAQRAFLEHLFDVGVNSCKPGAVLPDLLPKDAPAGRNIVLGAGKAAAEMAAIANTCLQGPTEGLVVTRYGHGSPLSTGNISVIEAGHPVPDTRSVEAADRMLEIASGATANDRVLFMMSGGGSALLCAPIDGISVAKKQEITRFLLHSGARIDEINSVRKCLSRIKGGGLANEAKDAELLTFVISDVVGDEPSDVASGPSIGDPSDVERAISVLEKYGYADVANIAGAMRAAVKPRARLHPVVVAATAATALDAITAEVESAGWEPVRIGDDIEGDATQVGRAHAGLALQYRNKGGRFALLSGGELTVQVRNVDGHGGPNLEYLTSLMVHLDGAEGIEAIACDSDGVDGSEDNAGGYLSPDSLARARSSGIEPAESLANNNSYEIFAALGDLVITGPTRTNINDIRIILVDTTGTNTE
jgi:hydroxypyruvate reductase